VQKKVEEAKAILSKKYPKGVPLGKLLEEALDVYLEKHSPKRKIERREKRMAKTEAHKNELLGGSSKAKKRNDIKTAPAFQNKMADPQCNKRSRHIPQAVQDEVFARDHGRCSYVGPDGVRCDSTWNLEIDHIRPFAGGGVHSIDNLRLLCAKHNNLEAERIYDRKFMELQKHKTKTLRE
jgi:5-methylcytosine-specific restriction endonuclease McrA